MGSEQRGAEAKGAGLPRVLVLVDAAGDRRVLASWLRDRHDVIEAAEDDDLQREFDLCLVDDVAYARVWRRVGERKRASEPVFLPFVLLTSAHGAPLIAQLPTHDIDETLDAPIAPDVLVARIDVLLNRRGRERRLDDAREEAMEELRAARETVTQELETTTMLLDTARALASISDLPSVLDQVARSMLSSTRRKRILVSLWDEASRQLQLLASAGERAAPVGTRYDWDGFAEPTQVAMSERRTVVADYDRSASEGARYVGPLDMHISLVVPLVEHDVLIGLIVVDDPGERHEFGRREIEVIEGIAAQAATAIQNAQLLDTERERTRFGQSMAEISTRLASSLDIGQSLTGVLNSVCDEIAACGAVVSDRVAGGWRIRRRAGPAGPVVGEGFVLEDDRSPASMEALQSRRPVMVPDVESGSDANRELAGKVAFRSCAVYPLIVRDEVTGVLTVLFSEPRSLSDIERDYLQRVAFAISVSQENSRLYMAQHDIADRLQSALLALPDEVRGVEFAHAYHSATEAARVGGDFYDLFELDDDRVGIVMGDVAGKGIDAAVLTSMAKNTIRAHAHERGKTPKRILELTNEVVFKATPPEAFVTVFFGLLDCRDGRLVYGNAGHTTTAVVRADGTLGALGVTGPLLGAFDDVEYDQAETCLELGELLLLYSDGLTEARRDGELYGEARLFDFLASTHGGSTRDLVHGVIENVMAYTGNRLSDDLALLAVKRVELGGATPQQRKLEM